MPQKGAIHIVLVFALVTLATIGIYFNQKNISLRKEPSVVAADNYLVKPYLVYPSDKPTYPEYEQAIKTYMAELQAWYGKMVGKTFEFEQPKVIKSTQNYLTMRCGENPSNTCIQNPSKLEGNVGQFVNKAIHGGIEKWDDQTVTLVFVPGAGGYAGGSKISEKSGWAIVGDWVLEPLSGKENIWGIACKYSDGWQCSGNTPKGTPAHEIGHAFGLDHPPAGSKSIMAEHGLYPSIGFLESEIKILKASPFLIKTEPQIVPLKLTPIPSPTTTSVPLGKFTWNIQALPCAIGQTQIKKAKLAYAIWPPNPLTWIKSSLKIGEHSVQIKVSNNVDISSVYVRVESEDGKNAPLAKSPHQSIVASKFFSPPTDMVRWYKNNLSPGDYTLIFNGEAIGVCKTN